jgi:hypothetical protein
MRRSWALATVLLAIFTAPAAADWLVTREGGKVETRGAWKVKGKQVVFTRADGQLASLRVSEVDWAASEQATGKAKETPPQEAPPAVEEKKESRWVLTDSDFERRAPPAAPKETEKPPAAEEIDGAGRPLLPVVVETWDRRNHPDGLEIFGTLRNPGNELAAEIGVTVRLYDETGALLATSEGRVATPALAPEARAGFRATFPGVFTYAEAKLEVRGYGLRIKAAPEAEKP